MLRVRIEVVPGGDEHRARVVEELRVSNEGADPATGEVTYGVVRAGSDAQATVRGDPCGALRLGWLALGAALGEVPPREAR